jgi:23S rRNA (adenine2503-C2)-methyltransferase
MQGGAKWEDAKFLPLYLREWLSDRVEINHGKIMSHSQSTDGTRKYLVQVSPMKVVETVLIPEEDRGTLCVSSQVGCSLNCTFCHTGTQKFESNLTSSEILRQFYALPARDMITNFVFMGQGEPLYNFKNVSRAVLTLTGQENGLGFGKGKITISTSGIAPLIPKIASELGANLAVSLHAPNDELRTEIMPINKTFPLAVLMQACREFIELASCATRRVSFEYVMLKDVNDRPEHARQLVSLIKRLPAHINLIPFNQWPGASYQCSDYGTIRAFQDYLEQRGIPTTIRKARGRDIMAACGQLKSSRELKDL